MKKLTVPMIAGVGAALILTGCAPTTVGEPAASSPTPSTVTVYEDETVYPTFPKTTEPAPRAAVVESPQAMYQQIAAFWKAKGVDITHVSVRESAAPLTCHGLEYRDTPAFYCDGRVVDRVGDVILYTPELPTMDADAARIIVAHEAGHAIQDEMDDGAGVETGADCLAGHYVTKTGVDPTARAATPIGSTPERLDAFRFGQSTADPTICLDRYPR